MSIDTVRQSVMLALSLATVLIVATASGAKPVSEQPVVLTVYSDYV